MGWGDSWVTETIERTNKIPTHDPYTNPNAQLYYSCECGQILDPQTKSFALEDNQRETVANYATII
jgi:hypothetical protein